MLHKLLLACLCTMVSACWDFVEPELPAEAGVSVLQLTALLEDNGLVQISGLLAPGIDADGFRRRILNDTLGVFGIRFPPTASRASGSREYSRTEKLTGVAVRQPFTVEAPQLEAVSLPAVVAWYGVYKLDPDTVRISRGQDLVLRLDVAAMQSAPPPGFRSWSLDLRGAGGSFQLNGTGVPPAELRVPAIYLPVVFVEGSQNNLFQATLLFSQSSVIRATNYRGNYGFTVRLNWTVVVE